MTFRYRMSKTNIFHRNGVSKTNIFDGVHSTYPESVVQGIKMAWSAYDKQMEN